MRSTTTIDVIKCELCNFLLIAAGALATIGFHCFSSQLLPVFDAGKFVTLTPCGGPLHVQRHKAASSSVKGVNVATHAETLEDRGEVVFHSPPIDSLASVFSATHFKSVLVSTTFNVVETEKFHLCFTALLTSTTIM